MEENKSKLFGGKPFAEDFVKDLKTFLSSDQKLQDEILSSIPELETLSTLFPQYEELSKKYNLPESVIIGLFSPPIYILREIAINEITLEDVKTDVSQILTSDEIKKFSNMFDKTCTKQFLEKIKVSYWRGRELSFTESQFIDFSILPSIKIVTDDNYNVLDKISITSLRISYRKDGQTHSLTMNFTVKQLESLFNMMRESLEKTKKLF